MLRKTTFLIGFCWLLFVGCGIDEADVSLTIASEAANLAAATVSALPSATPYPTQTMQPTFTPFPTQTAYPTYTPYPTLTPLPTATATATPTATPTQTATATATAVSNTPVSSSPNLPASGSPEAEVARIFIDTFEDLDLLNYWLTIRIEGVGDSPYIKPRSRESFVDCSSFNATFSRIASIEQVNTSNANEVVQHAYDVYVATVSNFAVNEKMQAMVQLCTDLIASGENQMEPGDGFRDEIRAIVRSAQDALHPVYNEMQN